MVSLSDKIQSTFNSFSGTNHSLLDSFYATNVVFEDPVTKVQGLPALKKYYAHAYKNVKSIRFDFSRILEQEKNCTAEWVMTINVRGLNGGEPYQVHGVSLLVFNDEGLVSSHRDYVDLGEMIYERIPVQGFVIKKIKRLLTQN